ncbi:MASE3 domain-containing protein [Bacillus sp. FJAT-29814]|uniref:MASE3 domain-containing protein n=1 Tax=Bacillus sp. FJAT-29814 TaxID=1729688 RepID=UPI0009E6A994|nr:MASE3 domain-containing protein [Bacillus sp. FJAT-29814]
MMKSQLTEGKFLVYSTMAIVLLLGIHLFQEQINTFYNPNNYVGFHTLLESFSISTSSAIMLYGLKNYGKSGSSQMLLLSFTFLVVGTLDMLHTLTFKGMPFFLTESSVAKATWFWVSARAIQAVLILAILVLPNWKLKKDYRFPMYLLAFLMIGAIGTVVFTFEKSLPLLVIEGKGTTLLKNGIEYFVCFVQFLALIFTLYKYHMERSETKLAIALALFFLLLTSLIFTIYRSVFDLDNFTGHIFKAIGFYYILKGFYFKKGEFERAEMEHQKLINDLPGFIFKAAKKGNQFVFTYGAGELLQQLHIEKDELIGRPLKEVFAANPTIIHEYCQLALNLQDKTVFEMEHLDKTLLISIKPVFEEFEQEVVIGSVIEMTGFYQEPAMKGRNKKRSKFAVM